MSDAVRAYDEGDADSENDADDTYDADDAGDAGGTGDGISKSRLLMYLVRSLMQS